MGAPCCFIGTVGGHACFGASILNLDRFWRGSNHPQANPLPPKSRISEILPKSFSRFLVEYGRTLLFYRHSRGTLGACFGASILNPQANPLPPKSRNPEILPKSFSRFLVEYGRTLLFYRHSRGTCMFWGVNLKFGPLLARLKPPSSKPAAPEIPNFRNFA